MRSVYVIGSYSTEFKKWTEKSNKELAGDCYISLLEDCMMKKGDDIESAYFANCGMGVIWGQDCVRGHSTLAPLVEKGIFPERVPIINVEGACASGSMAFHLAWKDILSGLHDVSLAFGLDKFYHTDMKLVLEAFEHGIDREEKPRLIEEYKAVAAECGRTFDQLPGHTLFMDTYAMQACWHMWKWGTTQRQIAVGASKNHYHGSLNPKAQYKFEISVDDVLNDYEVTYPLTRSMCAPIGDGAAAVILCSEDYLQGLPQKVQDRAVKVLASAITSGKHRPIAEPGLSKYAADKAYKIAGIGPQDIDVAEVHDATSFCEIYQVEMLGFCPIGEGGNFVESGATMLNGSIPVNTSGGLVSKGHPIGSTGLSMIDEIVTQLRGEAGARQVKNAEIGLTENGGGVISVEEMACAVNILRKS